MGLRSYGTPKVGFDSHMFRILLFDQASLILFDAETVVGIVPHPIHKICIFCVTIIFFNISAFPCCSHEAIEKTGRNFKQKCVSFFEGDVSCGFLLIC